MSEIRNLKPEIVWRNFHDLTQVPRPSGHLEQVKAFLLDFAARVGVEARVDEAGNILLTKPASPGMEGRKGIILQAHMDMVPQRSPESNHDFERDPILTYIDGEWVRARNTTLGADNGLGVAAIMAVMEDKTLVHGLVEGLITADEETGMYGANDLPQGELKGDILLNLDSETWGTFVVGSAGGIDIDAKKGYKEVATNAEDVALYIVLKGLKGGHSGLEIHEGRANANKLLARILLELKNKFNISLAEWHGGNMRNAIPYKAETVIILHKNEVAEVKAAINELKIRFEAEYRFVETGVDLSISEVEKPEKRVSDDDFTVILNAIYGLHNGVLRMIPAIPAVVETSSNLAIIDISEGLAAIKILARSSSETMKEYICNTLISVLDLAGFITETSGSYQGWDPNTDSEILKLLQAKYKELFNEEAIVKVDHAGLECSIILGKYPHLDVVSFGPTIRSPHSTSERALHHTVAPFWEILKAVLVSVPKK